MRPGTRSGGETAVTKAPSENAASTLGSRVRTLRRAAGMTQVELADGRFSKQYVSQIERGETPPSDELVAWLAERLGVDREVIHSGFSGDESRRTRAALDDVHRQLAEHSYAEALTAVAGLKESLVGEVPAWAHHDIGCAEAWALIRLGRLDEAAAVLTTTSEREPSAEPTVGQAEIAYVTAVCRLMGSDIEDAQASFNDALRLLDAADEPNDALRCDIHQWRSRCYRRQRDFEAAREDIDRALELCEPLNDIRRSAEVNLQASLVAERQGRWVLARRYAGTSSEQFEAVGDRVTVGRVLNNLAGLNHSLGNDEIAIEQLREAFVIFVDAQLEAEAGYVLSSLAEIHRSRGDHEAAGLAARQALERLGGRIDHVQETGTAELVLARTHLAQGEFDEAENLLAAADRSYAQTESVSHQARSWMARGELELLRENDAEAARLYRQAAIVLQPADS